MALQWAVILVNDRRWEELVRFVAGQEGEASASRVSRGSGWLPLHYAACIRAPLEVVRALLDAYPQGAQTMATSGMLPLHIATASGAPLEVIRLLLNAYPQGAQTLTNDRQLPMHLVADDDDDEENYRPKVDLMLVLAHAGFPPSRPWTPETCATLRGIRRLYSFPKASCMLACALIDEHLSRVRTLLLSLHRLGLPSALAPLLAGALYTADILC